MAGSAKTAAFLLATLCSIGPPNYALSDENAVHEKNEQVAAVIISDEQEVHREPLLVALEGQLVEVEARLAVQIVPSLPRGYSNRVRMAKKIARHKNARVVCWYDFEDEKKVYLFIPGDDGERMLVRNLSDDQGVQVYEDAAIIIRSAMEAISHGEEIGISVEAAQDGPVEGSEGPTGSGGKPGQGITETGRREGSEFIFRAAFVYSAVSRARPAVGGMGLWLGARFRDFLFIGASTRFSSALTQTEGNLQVTSRRVPIHLAAEMTVTINKWRLGGGLSLGFDISTNDIAPLADGARAGDRDTFAGMSATATATAAFALGKKIWLFFALGADAYLVRNAYIVEINGESTNVNSVWPISPLGFIGLELEIM